MYYRLKSFLKKRNIFNDSQYGYGVGEGPPVLALQWLDNKSGVYDMHIHQCKRQGTGHP